MTYTLLAHHLAHGLGEQIRQEVNLLRLLGAQRDVNSFFDLQWVSIQEEINALYL